MTDLILNPAFWASLFGVTLIQIALGADNLIIITIIAGKLPQSERKKAVQLGLILAMLFRIVLLAAVTLVLSLATADLFAFDTHVLPGLEISADVSGKALVLAVGGLFLIWKGIHELRIKLKGVEGEVQEAARFKDFMKDMSTIDGEMMHAGTFEWTDPNADPTDFINELRESMIRGLAELRRGDAKLTAGLR